MGLIAEKPPADNTELRLKGSEARVHKGDLHKVCQISQLSVAMPWVSGYAGFCA